MYLRVSELFIPTVRLQAAVMDVLQEPLFPQTGHCKIFIGQGVQVQTFCTNKFIFPTLLQEETLSESWRRAGAAWDGVIKVFTALTVI